MIPRFFGDRFVQYIPSTDLFLVVSITVYPIGQLSVPTEIAKSARNKNQYPNWVGYVASFSMLFWGAYHCIHLIRENNSYLSSAGGIALGLAHGVGNIYLSHRLYKKED